ncbi:hypothetical protein pb186bvf_002742 [Paramecium bursaria]
MISYKHSTDSLFLTAPSPSTQPSSTSIQGQIKFHIDINRSSCTFRSPQSCLNSDSRSFRLSQDYKIPEINLPNKNELRMKTDSSEMGKHFQTYRNFNKIKYLVKNENYQVNKTSYSMLRQANKQDILPKTLGMLNQQQHLSMAGKLSNPQYFNMFLEGLNSQEFRYLESLDISNNNITPHLTSQCIYPIQIQLYKNLPLSLDKINLANTKLNKLHIDSVNYILQNKIQNIQLQNNTLNDLKEISQTLRNYDSIYILNLSANKIGNQSIQDLNQYIRQTQNLQELYQSYNRIRRNRLIKNQSLKVLDLSYNSLGRNLLCTQSLCELIKKPNLEILHYDLSHNNFSEAEVNLIATELSFNQTIYGFHFDGNGHNFVNSRGFLVYEQEQIKFDQNQIYKELDYVSDVKNYRLMRKNSLLQKFIGKQPQIVRVNGVRQIQSTNIVFNQMKDICWICQGWVEIKFTYHPKRSGQLESFPIFIHFQFEDFRPTLMEQYDDYSEIHKMCPPNQQIRYFFSCPTMGILSCARDQGMVSTRQDKQIYKNNLLVKYNDGTVFRISELPYVNYKNSQHQQLVIDQERNYNCMVFSKPRNPEKIYNFQENNIKLQKWSIETSFFKSFQSDEERLLQCLEFDLSQMKIFSRIDDKENFKQSIIPYYPQIVQFYKFSASQSFSIRSFPRIDESVIKLLYDNIKKYIPLTNWTLMLVQTQKVKDKDSKLIHEFSLVRYQFLEIIIRVQQELQLTFPQCMEQVFPFVDGIELSQDWRNQRYWTQIMDLTINLKLLILQGLFDYAYSLSLKRYAKQKKYIQFQDLKNLIQQSDILDKQMNEQELYQIYLQSQELVIDELTETDHFEMNFEEFVEAIARIAEFISPSSPHIRQKFLAISQRKILPLYIKFEGLLYILFHKLKNKIQQQNFLNLEQTVLNHTVIKSWQIKKKGLKIDFVDESDESDNEKTLLEDPNQIIDSLLSIRRKIKIESYKQITQEKQVRTSQQRKSVKFNQPLNSLKLIKDASEIQKINEQRLLENSSPYSQLQIVLKRNTLKALDLDIECQDDINKLGLIQIKDLKKQTVYTLTFFLQKSRNFVDMLQRRAQQFNPQIFWTIKGFQLKSNSKPQF